ncbi:MAG: ATP-dependent metallopeptidase FtsH/Yme1/Tma family protein [Gammaproteobacteria bacterium]|nr:ATP-dependent metallopeptidase FtsH/Yme1/Tma family protein [Gammaproteobacteria bacterium]
MKNDVIKNLFLWLVICVILVLIFNNFGPKRENVQQITYSKFIGDVKAQKVDSVVISDQRITGTFKGVEDHQGRPQQFSTYLPLVDLNLLPELLKENITVEGKPPEEHSILLQILISWFPMLLLLGIMIFIFRQQMGGGRGGAFSFGRSRARLMSEGQIQVTFADVAGCDEAKQEVKEVVDFLRDSSRFQKVGARVPKGILLVGVPGTGKTLLAKAVAGEAKVPFFSISGSDFVEMFVGVGASRVRDMFEQAKKQAPCVIFIDELDAVGRHRGAGLGGGHDEREQTLNQLLVEMDGFKTGGENVNVIVLAATNRPDVLDPALLRPGRFDRQVVVPLPDIRGREQILKIHMKQKKLDKSIKALNIARGTPGFSGADLENLVNEAALFAGRASKSKVTMEDMEQAKDKILMGAERRSMVMNEAEKKLTAYHEAGHAIVGLHMPDHDPVYKVTIIPRGRALGVTMYLPEEDRYSYSKQRLESQLASMFGGRVAEELIFGKQNVTTGASNDIEKATEIARNMVTKWGLSEKMGPLQYSEDDGEVFLAQAMVSKHKEIADETAKAIDDEVRRIIDEAYTKATQILTDKLDLLHQMAEVLIKYETIQEEQIKALLAGKAVTPPAGWSDELKEPSSAQTDDEDDEDTDSQAAQDDEKAKSKKKPPRKRQTKKPAPAQDEVSASDDTDADDSDDDPEKA